MLGESPEYAIAGSYTEFMEWRRQSPKERGRVILLNTAQRAEQLAVWAPKGVLHRIGTWETSPARNSAEQLEAYQLHKAPRRVPPSPGVQ